MSDESLQYLAAAIIALSQLYSLNAGQGAPFLARVWDIVARITGILANWLGNLSLHARLAYFEAVQI